MTLRTHVRTSFYLASATTWLTACGSGGDSRSSTTTPSVAFTSDAVVQEAVSASYGEAMDSLSDSNLTASAGTSFRLASPVSTVDYTKTCAVNDGKAVVTIKGLREMSASRSNTRVSIDMSRKLDNLLVRTWSKTGQTLACNASGKGPAIDFEADLSGYQLDVNIDRTASRTFTITNLKKSTTTTAGATTTVKGTRSIAWMSELKNTDGTITREKSVAFDITRSSKITDKDGTITDVSLTMKTLAAAPLKVSHTWDSLSESRQLLSKTIKEGSLHVKNGTGTSYLEAKFDNMLLEFTSSSCAVKSGTMTSTFYTAEGSSASKIYKLEAVDGVISVQNITDAANPTDVDDFEYTPCDLKDFDY